MAKAIKTETVELAPKKLTLEDFRSLAKDRLAKKVHKADIEVDNYGLVEFIRPSTDLELEYQNSLMSAFKFKDKEMQSADLTKVYEASARLVYNCCPFLKDKELQEDLDIKDPLDAPLLVFGTIDIVNNVAEKIIEVFGGEKITKEIKN